MDKTIKFVDSESNLADDIFDVFTEVGDNGDIILLEHDGARNENPFTVVIIVSGATDGIFRCDGASIVGALKVVLPKYLAFKLVR